MKKYISLFIVFTSLLLFSLSACDEGKIYPEEIKHYKTYANLSIEIKGDKAFPQKELLVLAGFGDDATTPITTTVIPEPTASVKTINVQLGLKGDEKYIAICTVTKGTVRNVVYEFYRYDLSTISEEEIDIPISELNLSSFDRVQSQIFNDNCIICHGGSTEAGGGLYLTEGNSYKSLVNVIAPLSKENKVFVKPGEPDDSFVMDVLSNDILDKYDHSDIFASMPEYISLMESWIEEGAKE
ncbi:hypothetical protein [Parabacteroides timonensis]|uniref:hypothetical protein n=1 Tax=Parabacteroides timonensis TaxID=1871013 RepID=UPI00094E3A2F|nr:hypothetical protein [Parabacteroides timonensis]